MMTLADQAAASIAASGWDAHKRGDSDAAQAYWAAARIIAAVFKEPTDGN